MKMIFHGYVKEPKGNCTHNYYQRYYGYNYSTRQWDNGTNYHPLGYNYGYNSLVTMGL